jgi:hypothetical protein
MVAQLQAKPGAAGFEATIGEVATTQVEGTSNLAYLVYDTITNLTTQDEQVEMLLQRCRTSGIRWPVCD